MNKIHDYDNTILTLRLESSEAVRFWKLMDLAKERNPYATKSDVIRELLGLAKPFVLKSSEIAFFRASAQNDKTLDENIVPDRKDYKAVKNLKETSKEQKGNKKTG